MTDIRTAEERFRDNKEGRSEPSETPTKKDSELQIREIRAADDLLVTG